MRLGDDRNTIILRVALTDGILYHHGTKHDIRFPELFRQLYRERVDLCFVCFSDTNETPMPDRYATIRAHLVTRAVENVMTVVSVNSLSRVPTAPTAVFDCNGTVVEEAESGREMLLLYDFSRPEMSFGMKGRIVNNNAFLGIVEPDGGCDRDDDRRDGDDDRRGPR